MVVVSFVLMMVVTIRLNFCMDWRIRDILMGIIQDLSIDMVVCTCAVWEQDVQRSKGTHSGQCYVKLAMSEDRLSQVDSNTNECTS